MKVRNPVFAGRFYPSNKNDIASIYESVLKIEKSKINYTLADKKLIGAVMPHAGFMYCGYQAIHVLEILKSLKNKPETIIIINPNHTGHGEAISIDSNDSWKTPIRMSNLDQNFCTRLGFSISDLAHQYEHSGEVILPFLQYALDVDFEIVPICISVQNIENAKKIASAIFQVNHLLNKNIFIIASSDFSHFVSPHMGNELDRPVIAEIEKLNAISVEQKVKEKNISICGFGPIMSLIEYAKLESKDSEVTHLRSGHSGEVYPSDDVVHYHSLLIHNP